MKTPREILLERHRAAEPKLDAIRQATVAGVCDRRTPANVVGEKWQSQTAATSILQLIWCELFFPSRRVWTVMAAVWLLIFAVNFSQRDPVSSVTGQPVRSPAVMMSWQIQQRWMNELLADRLTPSEADQPKTFLPKPRTETNEAMTA
jgi:uncharacterized membrane protein